MLFFSLMLQGNALVRGLNQDQASVILSWSKQAYYQGEKGSLIVTFESQCPEELKIKKLQLQFDWTDNHESNTKDLSDDPAGIPSDDNYVFDPIEFQIPNDALEGNHSLQVKLEGIQHGLLMWYDFEWISSSFQIEIKTEYQQLYTRIKEEVSISLAEAQKFEYNNQDAIDLLDDAFAEYNVALSLANQKKWEEAISHLDQTQDYIQQAQVKEEQILNENLTLNIGIIIALIIIGLIVPIILSRKSKK